MFKVSFLEKNGLDVCQIEDLQRGEYITILPKAGCALNNFVINKNNDLIDLIDGYSDSNDLEENIEKSFKGHFLFPFPNRIYGANYTFQGKRFQLRKNFPSEDNAIHGLVYNEEFFLKDFMEYGNSASISFFKDIAGETEGFPFNCSITIHFTFTSKYLTIKSEVINTGENDMPVGMGWHPYFRTGNNISELSLEISDSEQWNLESIGFSPVNKNSINERMNNLKLDNCFKLNSGGNISLKDLKSGIEIFLETDEELSYLQVYTPPHGKSIAIEPMTCAPDSFNNKVGLKLLSKNQRWSAEWSVKVKELIP